MTTSVMPTPLQRYFTNSGTPAAGCKLHTYAAGTTTPKATFQDAAGTVQHTNPITLDSKGEALIYWEGNYKIDLKTAAGVQITGYPVDNYKSTNASTIATSAFSDYTDRGAWATATVYSAKDIFYAAGIAYATVIAHTSTNVAADLAAGKVAVHQGATREELASAVGSALVGWNDNGTPMMVEAALDLLYYGVYNIKNPRFAGGAKCDGVTDDSAAVQAAVTYIGTLGGGVMLHPGGDCLLSTAITVVDYLQIIGNGTGLFGGTASRGSYFVVNNVTAAFTGASVKELGFNGVGFRPTATGLATAFAYKQTNLAVYSERCVFKNCNIWANMGGGFYGNFILTTWRRCTMGYLGSAGAQFLPIYSKGAIAGNQSNANLIEGCYILNSAGSDTVFFEAGTDITLRNVRFETCKAASTIHFKGMMVSTLDGVYIENSNGASTLYPIIYEDDTTAVQGCSVINIRGCYAYLAAVNTHLIRHLGGSGGMVFTGNRVDNIAGKNMTSSASGTNKGFAQYTGNITSGFTGCSSNVRGSDGSWTPTLVGSGGTAAHTYTVQAGKYTRNGKTVIAHFRVSISAKDAGATGTANISLAGLPVPDAPPSGGFSGSLQQNSGITYPAGTTQIGVGVSSTTLASLTASGSGSVLANVTMASLAAATTIIGVLMYETSDA